MIQQRLAQSLDGDVLVPSDPGVARGQYVNTLSDEGAEGVRRAYPPDKLARLTLLKDKYDPENVFHLNHNIRPSDGS